MASVKIPAPIPTLVIHTKRSSIKKNPSNRTFFFFAYYLFIDFLFINISNVIPFFGFPTGNTPSQPLAPCFHEGAPPLAQPLQPPHPGIPLHWGTEPSQDQEPLHPLMSNKASLCYVCDWSQGLVHVNLAFCCIKEMHLSEKGRHYLRVKG